MGAPDDELDWPGDEEGADEAGGGPGALDWARLALAAVWKRKLLVTLLVLSGATTLTVYYRSRTPMYRVEARILAQRQQALPSIVRPTGLDEAPTRSAQDFIRRRESLVSMVSQAKLDFSKAPREARAEEVLDKVKRALRMQPAEAEDADPMDAMVRRVEQALKVQIEEGTILVQVDWPEPNQAFLLAQAALQNFLEGRHLQEVTTIDESLSMLEARVETLRADLDKAIAETSRASRPPAGEADAAARALPRLPPQASEELVTLKSQLDAKERAIRDVDEFRRRRLMELQTQLEAQRGIYSDAHPIIIGLQRDLESLSQESPQILSMREDEKRLRKEYTTRLAAELQQQQRAAAAAAPAVAPPAATGSREEPERVKDARLRYQRMVDRMGAAQLELDAARASFKYRYDVSWPARVPKDPFSPNPRKIFGLGGLLVLLGAAGTAVLLELRGGRITQRWQLERALKLRILGELGPR